MSAATWTELSPTVRGLAMRAPEPEIRRFHENAEFAGIRVQRNALVPVGTAILAEEALVLNPLDYIAVTSETINRRLKRAMGYLLARAEGQFAGAEDRL